MTNLIRIAVTEVAGPNCVTLADGQLVYQKIYPELIAGRHVELNFGGVRVAASPFFNAAIGQLLKDIPSEKLNHLLKVTDLSPAGIDTLKKVIENSRDFYHHERTRKAVTETMSKEEE